jgi:hypothetical protein
MDLLSGYFFHSHFFSFRFIFDLHAIAFAFAGLHLLSLSRLAGPLLGRAYVIDDEGMTYIHL